MSGRVEMWVLTSRMMTEVSARRQQSFRHLIEDGDNGGLFEACGDCRLVQGEVEYRGEYLC